MIQKLLDWAGEYIRGFSEFLAEPAGSDPFSRALREVDTDVREDAGDKFTAAYVELQAHVRARPNSEEVLGWMAEFDESLSLLRQAVQSLGRRESGTLRRGLSALSEFPENPKDACRDVINGVEPDGPSKTFILGWLESGPTVATKAGWNQHFPQLSVVTQRVIAVSVLAKLLRDKLSV